MENVTTSEIARRAGITRQRVYQIAASMGLRPCRIVGTAGLWTEDAASAIVGHRRPRESENVKAATANGRGLKGLRTKGEPAA